jgi:hypothetical protein
MVLLTAGGRVSGGAKPVACSNDGGGEFGTGGAGGGTLDSKVGGKREEEEVGNGNGGGASSFSGTSRYQRAILDILYNGTYHPRHSIDAYSLPLPIPKLSPLLWN